MGVTVFVGQKIGEGKPDDAGKAIGTGIVLFSILGLLISALTIIFTKQLATLMQCYSCIATYGKGLDYLSKNRFSRFYNNLY